jgi:hypothetical protein
MPLSARLTLGALSLAVVATSASAQRPDFSGTWTRADSGQGGRGVAATGDAAFRRGDMGSGWGSPIAITQTSDRLGVEVTWFSTYDLQPKLKFSYALNGTESRNVVMIGHADSDQRSTASWSGDTLVIVTKFRAPAGVQASPDLRQSIYLDAAKNLTVASRRAGADGAPNVISATYTKR